MPSKNPILGTIKSSFSKNLVFQNLGDQSRFVAKIDIYENINPQNILTQKSQVLICCFQGFHVFIKNTFLFSHKSFLPCIFHNKSESTLVQSVSNNEKLHNKKVTNVFAPSLFYFDLIV